MGKSCSVVEAMASSTEGYQSVSSSSKRSDDNDDGVVVVNELMMEDAIELLGIGPYQHRIAWIAGLCLSADGIEILLLSFLSIVLQVDWNLSSSEAATITSCVFLGSFVGTILQGPLGDRCGRRPVFLTASGLIAGFGFLTACSNTFLVLVAMRFVVGIGLGGCFVPFDALSEVLPSAYRGKNLMYLEFLWTAGTTSVPVIAFLTLGQGYSWRYFVAACAMPCTVAVLLGYWLVPESPRYLVTHGRADEALRILRQAAQLNSKDPDQLFPEGTVLKVRPEDEEKGLFELFTKKWLRTTLLFLGTGFGEGFLYYSAVLAITLVFSTHSTGNNHHGTGAYHFNYGAIFTSCTAEFVGAFLVIVVVDRIGRIRTQGLSWVLGGLSTACMCLLASVSGNNNNGHNNSNNWSWGVILVLAFSARIYMMSGSSTLWISVAEIMTTNVRTTGHSAVFAAGRIGGFLCPYLVKTTTPLPTIAWVVLAIAAFATATIAFLPETKDLALGQAVDVLPKEDEQDLNDSNKNESDRLVV